MTDTQLINRTLEWCNRQRKKSGKSPLKNLPKGQRYNPESCPCGQATGLSVGLMNFNIKGKSKNFNLPMSVRLFVAKFDNGHFPKYEINPGFLPVIPTIMKDQLS